MSTKRNIGLALLALAATATAAHADGITIDDRGDAVEVMAPALVAKDKTIKVVRHRLEIPLDGKPLKRSENVTDGTIKQIEIKGSPAVISIKLDLDKPVVKALVPHVAIEQLDTGLRIRIPRQVPSTKAAAPVPVPVPVPLPAKAEAPKPEAPKPEAPKAEAPKPEAAKTEAPAPAPAAAIAKAPAPTPAPQTQNAPAAPAQPKSESSIPDVPLLAGLGGLGLLAAIYLHRKRKTPGPVQQIDVLAQRSLGGKAKVVWLAVGGREMVVAVTPQHVRTLGSWRKAAEVANGAVRMSTVGGIPYIPARHKTIGEGSVVERLPAAPETQTPAALAPALSPAVSGILRLRAKTVRPPSETELEPTPATDDDDDAVWARELRAATGGRK